MAHGSYPRRTVLRGAAMTAVGLTGGASGACVQPLSRAGQHSHPHSTAPVAAPPPPGQRWVPHFGDTFGSIDTTVWYRYDNTYGTGAQCEHWLRPGNLHADGTLTVLSKREEYHGRKFTSGFLSTGKRGGNGQPTPQSDTFFPRAGFYEMRGKVTHAQGLWPACWLRHRNGASVAEVDIMEVFHNQEPGKTRQTLHLDGVHNTYQVSTPIEDPAAEPGWHVWGVAILPDTHGVRFRFYTDGEQVGDYLAEDPAFWHDHPETDLWDISIDTYIGGVWVGHPDDPLGYSRYNGGFCLSSGTPPHCDSTNLRSARFPATFEVDYVRVWTVAPQQDDARTG